MIKDYSTKYIQICDVLNECSSKNEVKKHNLAMKKLSKLYHEFEKETDKSFLLDLLNHDNIYVREMAASHCLGLNIYVNEAIKILENLKKNKESDIVAFNAQSTLEIWKEQGFLLF